MPDTNDRSKDAVSTLVLVGDKEYVLRASRAQLLFDNYSSEEASLEQEITLTLDYGDERHLDSTPLAEIAAVPVILSRASTPRFELSANEEESSPFDCLLSPLSSRTYTIKFNPPKLSESNYAWDNFQDQIVIHTRLSKLVIHLEAWKFEGVAHDRRHTLLFPASLPDVKAPPLKLFSVIERNGEQQSPARLQYVPLSNHAEATKLTTEESNTPNTPFRTPRTEYLPSVSRPTSSEWQPSPSVLSRDKLMSPLAKSTGKPNLPAVTAIQSQREAREVILKLRCRRTLQSSTKVLNGVSTTSVTDKYLFPETVALDADTKAELEDFNDLVVAARDRVKKDVAKAKNQLAYYQQLVPVPPPRECGSETPAVLLGLLTTAQNPRKARQMSAAMNRPSKLPSLARPSSGTAVIAGTTSSASNQEISPLDQAPPGMYYRQRSARPSKLQSLSASVSSLQGPRRQKALPALSKPRENTGNQQHQEQPDVASELSDLDDPDPEVDEAPVLPDDLSGVATLDTDDLHF